MDRSSLRTTFDAVADRYDAARPEYPAALFDDLECLSRLQPGSRLLEVGCATGKATRPLLERGHSVTCLEIGPRLAELARRNLAGLPAQVHETQFETWAGPTASFDLVFAATSWHWIDPAVRYGRAHELLRPGGHLAFWSAVHAFPQGFDPFFTQMQATYDAIGESFDGDHWPPPPPDLVPDDGAECAASGLFQDPAVRRFVWEVGYTADEYIALLDTFSGHIAMDPERRQVLDRAIRAHLAARPDGRVRRHWLAILHVARRIDRR